MEDFELVKTDVFNHDGIFQEHKTIYSVSKLKYINAWISLYKSVQSNSIGFMDGINGNDFQHNNIIYILNSKDQLPNPRGIWINANNLFPICIYYAIRKCISSTWLNDRDQFLCPNDGWQSDKEFQNDCLAFTLFNTNIKSEYGTNHWIPFSEPEVNATEKFESDFMSKFISGKVKTEQSGGLFGTQDQRTTPLVFSSEATAVFGSLPANFGNTTTSNQPAM